MKRHSATWWTKILPSSEKRQMPTGKLKYATKAKCHHELERRGEKLISQLQRYLLNRKEALRLNGSTHLLGSRVNTEVRVESGGEVKKYTTKKFRSAKCLDLSKTNTQSTQV